MNTRTGNVVCPASSMMHTSNLLLASKGLVIPKHVTPTTFICSSLCLMSSIPDSLVAVKENWYIN